MNWQERLRPGRAEDKEILRECPREGDVLDALASARWPSRVDPELVDHVAACAICRDVLAVASAIQADHELARRDATIPSSGQMWWRAEMRARHEAIREASRPVAVAQGVAAVVALVVAAAAGWFAWPSVRSAVFGAASVGSPSGVTSVFASPVLIPIAIAMGALLIVAPVAIYVVLSEK